MIEQIYNYFTIDVLYYWVNFGILPFWLILIFFTHSHLCRLFVTSIFPIFVLSTAYIFMLYKSYLGSFNFIGIFTLYLGIESIEELFTMESFLMMFWIHFISINLFVGGWIVKDAQKLYINKIILAVPLIITYLIGPIGLFVYWLIRMFHAKSINLYD